MKEHLLLIDGLTVPKTGNHAVDAILEVLHLDRVRENTAAAAVVADEGEYFGNSDDTIGAPTTDEDENMPDQVVVEVEQPLRILVRVATEEFGFVPHDVFKGLINLPDMRLRHVQAMADLNYSQLKDLINVFTRDKRLDRFMHRVVAVFLVGGLVLNDLWEIDFKSIWIAEDAVDTMWRKRVKTYGRYTTASVHSQMVLVWQAVSSRRSHMTCCVENPRCRMAP